MALVVLMLAVNVSAVNIYSQEYYSTNSTLVSGDINAVPVKEGEGCTVSLDIIGYQVGSNFDIGVNYYSPDSTAIGTAQRTGIDLINCATFGEFSTTTALNGFMESYMDYTTTATSGNITFNSNYSCEETSNYYDIEADMNDFDSFGNVPYRFGGTSASNRDGASLAPPAYRSNYYSCYSTLEAQPPYISIGIGGSSSQDYRRTAYAYYPFTTGSEGIVNWEFDLGNSSFGVLNCADSCVGTQTGYFDLHLVNVEDESYVTIYSDSEDCAGSASISGVISGSLILNTDTDYMFVAASRNDDAGTVFPCARSYTHREPIGFNISVYVYQPDWNCTAWGECIDGVQTRTCTDLNGVAVPKTEFRACSLVVLENVTFGFENSTERTCTICSPTWLFGCGYTIATRDVDVPEGWQILDNGEPDYFVQMTDEWATDGSRSLRMWVIPPAEGEPNSGGTSCINLTQSRYPTILKPINDTFLLSYNVTFPAENMLLSYDVKACPSQVLKHSALTGLFNVSLCPKTCYGADCDVAPNSNYVFNIQNINTSQSQIGNPFYDTGKQLTTTVSFPLEGVEVGVDYNVVFGTVPENLNDRTGQCIMIDNVRYEVIEEPITTLVPDCTSRCIGNDFYLATSLENGECSLAILRDSENCLDTAESAAVENLDNYCKDESTLRVFIPKSGSYQDTNCEEGFVCSPFPVTVATEGSCIPEDEAALDDSTVPAEDAEEFLNWFNWLFSPLFIYLIITFIIAGICGKAIGEGLATFLIFGTVEVVFIIIGTLPGIAIIPVWVSIAIIVIVALLMAKVLGMFSGSNN